MFIPFRIVFDFFQCLFVWINVWIIFLVYHAQFFSICRFISWIWLINSTNATFFFPIASINFLWAMDDFLFIQHSQDSMNPKDDTNLMCKNSSMRSKYNLLKLLGNPCVTHNSNMACFCLLSMHARKDSMYSRHSTSYLLKQHLQHCLLVLLFPFDELLRSSSKGCNLIVG